MMNHIGGSSAYVQTVVLDNKNLVIEGMITANEVKASVDLCVVVFFDQSKGRFKEKPSIAFEIEDPLSKKDNLIVDTFEQSINFVLFRFGSGMWIHCNQLKIHWKAIGKI